MRVLFYTVSFIGLCIFLWTIFFLDPLDEEGRFFVFMALYGGIFLFVTFFFFGIFFSNFTNQGRGGRMRVVRQSILLGILVCAILALQQLRILFWWSGALLVGFICLVELGFLAFHSRKE